MGNKGIDLRVKIRDKYLANPVGVASGTFGYGNEYRELINVNVLGALFTKAVTWQPRAGNPAPRLVETPAGLLNSIGLANVGVERFLQEKMPYLRELSCAIIPNIAGADEEEYLAVVEKLEQAEGIWGYEINLSCPNVKQGCLAFGTDPHYVERITRLLRTRTERPLIIKLTPNVTDIGSLARAAEAGGADAISCINTLFGMVVDIITKKPALPGVIGGLSGPAVRPVGVAMVYKVSSAVSLPVIGIGGIMETEDALQYLLAGASALQIGTGNFVDPKIPVSILAGLGEYMQKEKLTVLGELHNYKSGWV